MKYEIEKLKNQNVWKSRTNYLRRDLLDSLFYITSIFSEISIISFLFFSSNHHVNAILLPSISIAIKPTLSTKVLKFSYK